MRIVYLGSPKEVIAPLQVLLEVGAELGIEVVGVVTQPPRPKGRGKQLVRTPVGEFAVERGLRLFEPVKAGAADFLTSFTELAPDVAITAAYGQILTSDFLKIPKRATINIHPSALPQYRGATPVQAALLDGLEETGLSILFTVKELDAGHIILQRPFKIGAEHTTDTLLHAMFKFGGELLPEALAALKDAKFTGTPQDPLKVSFCRKINKEEGRIDWGLSAREVFNRYRAFNPWPGSFTFYRGERLSVLEMGTLEPGELRGAHLPPRHWCLLKEQKALAVGCADGIVGIKRLLRPGGKPVDALSFWNGLRDKNALVFDES